MLPRPLPLSLALALAASACDGPIDTRSEHVQAATAPARADREPAISGHVALDTDEYYPVAGAMIVIEAEDARAPVGSETITLELTADGAGYFELQELPITDGELVFEVFVDGEHGATHRVKVVAGKPTEKLIGIIVVTAWMACVVTTWASGAKVSGSDKMKHCVASCRATRWCGGAITGWTAAILKELFDSLCKLGPQWVKDLLTPVSGCTGWDDADLEADGRGIACATKWKTCEACCDGYY